MSKIPCKKCRSCGTYHDLSVSACGKCGTDLKNVSAIPMETKEIPADKYGVIDESVTVFVQKCSACGAMNFTSDKNNPVRVCCNCHKTRVASIVPEEYRENDETDNGGPAEQKESRSDARTSLSGKASVALPDAEDSDDDEPSEWQNILGNIKNTVGQEGASAAEKGQKPSGTDSDDADDDDGKESDWSGILGGQTGSRKGASDRTEKPSVTLTAIRYGKLSFTLSADMDEPYMLGRSENQKEFLEQDKRVSNEHCSLYFKNGFWYVKDNHSANGTAVNSRDIGLDGESRLIDGDELKLGHHPDSVAFQVKIK